MNLTNLRKIFPHLKIPYISKQAVSKARQKLSANACLELCRIFSRLYYSQRKTFSLWHGFYIYAVDGSTIQIPMSKENIDFWGSNPNQYGIEEPLASTSMLYDVLEGIIVDAHIGKYRLNESTTACEHIDFFTKLNVTRSHILLFDRGYPSYDLFHKLICNKLFFVMRLSKSFKKLIRTDNPDASIIYQSKGKKTPISLRIIHFSLPDGTIEHLVTNITDLSFTPDTFKELYFLRWGIESRYRELKMSFKLESFSGYKPEIMKQDFYATIFLSNLSAVIKNAADSKIKKQKENKHRYQANKNFIDKNDGIDSFVIADFARVGRIHIQPWRGAQYLALQRLTRHRLHITECIAREKTYMLNNIFLKFSEFAMLDKSEHPFSNKYGATAQAVLTDYLSTEAIVNASVDELVAFISTKSRGRISDPEQTTYLLQKAAQDSYRLNKCLYEPLTISIGCSFNYINAFEKELKAIADAILRTVKGLNPTEYQILNLVPGIGKVYASGVLAEIGTIKCFKNNDALAKYCGIVWKENQSGAFEAEDTLLNKAGNRYLRYYIIEAAGSVIAHCPEYKAFYEKKFAEVKTHLHKRALALTSRKLIRMLFGLLDKSQLYSVEKSR